MSAEIASLYAGHSSAHVSSALLSVIMGAIADERAQQLTPLVMVFGALVAALQLRVGSSVGAVVVENVIERCARGAGRRRRPRCTLWWWW